MNAGTVSIASGSTLDIQGSTYVQTAGVTNVNGVLPAAPTLVDIRGGTLSGAGTIVANVSNGGTVARGNSPGILFAVGNYTQTPAGILDIEIAGLTPSVADTSSFASLAMQLWPERWTSN